jgi:fatty acid omega-hydroxylase
LNQKYALNDDILPDGTHIKKGDYFVWSPYAQGRSEKTWGPDAKHFRPERWIGDDGDLKRESQGKWPAFHSGRKNFQSTSSFMHETDPFLFHTQPELA